MTTISLKLAEFTDEVRVMINDFKRLEKYTDELQANVAEYKNALAERDTTNAMLVQAHQEAVAEIERLRQALRFIHGMATECLRTDECGLIWSIEADARAALGLAVEDDERLDLAEPYSEEIGI
jgi:hypothetical protein